MNEEQPTEQAPAEAVPVEETPSEPARNEPQPQDPRRRLRELLAIPDHQRTDAIWDEIIELEICLAPGNRIQPGNQQAEPWAASVARPGSGTSSRAASPAPGPNAGSKASQALLQEVQASRPAHRPKSEQSYRHRLSLAEPSLGANSWWVSERKILSCSFQTTIPDKNYRELLPPLALSVQEC
jgi:hypothetical protein